MSTETLDDIEILPPYDIRDFQFETRDFWFEHERIMIGHKMGLGKTCCAYITLEPLLEVDPDLKILISGSVSSMPIWESEATRVDLQGRLPTIIEGDAFDRKELWANSNNFAVCTHRALTNDHREIQRNWDIIILDEAHRSWRNRKTQATKALKGLRSTQLAFLSGTLFRKDITNVWNYLNIIDRKEFPSYWRFVDRYSYVLDGEWGGKEIFGQRRLPELRELLSKYLIGYSKQQVAKDLPPKIRQKVPVHMGVKQRAAYEQFEKHMLIKLESDPGKYLTTSGLLGKLTRLRMMNVCPKMIDEALPQGAMLDAWEETLEENPHCVVFTPYKLAFPYIKAVADKYKIPIFFLSGGASVREIKYATKQATERQGILCATIKFSESWEILSTTYAHFLGMEPNPDENEQAEDRLHRLISVLAVNYYYYLVVDSIDDRTLEINNIKNRNVTAMIPQE